MDPMFRAVNPYLVVACYRINGFSRRSPARAQRVRLMTGIYYSCNTLELTRRPSNSLPMVNCYALTASCPRQDR